MKIAILFDQPQLTGLGDYAIRLYKLLSSNNIDVILIYAGAICDNNDNYTNKPYIKRTKIWILRPHIIRRNYRQIIANGDFNDYIFHYLGYYTYPLKLRPGVLTVHDLMKENLKDKMRLLKMHKFKESLVSIERNRQIQDTINLSSRALSVITVSQKTKNEFKKIVGINSKVIYHWISDKRFRYRTKEEALTKLKLELTFKYLLSVGTDRPNKRADLIRRFSTYLPENYKLIKIGAPIDSENVINVGTVDYNLYPIYFACTEGFLHLSEDEGFGIPIIEAIASNVPVICRINDINKELLGDAALLLNENFNQNDVINIVETLNDVGSLKKIQDSMKERMRMFEPERALSSYLEVYEKLAMYAETES